MSSEQEKLPAHCWFVLAFASLPALWVMLMVWTGLEFIGLGVTRAVVEVIAVAFPPMFSLLSPISALLMIVMGIVQFSLMIGYVTFPIALCCMGVLHSRLVGKHLCMSLVRITEDPIRTLRSVFIFNTAIAPVFMVLCM